MSLLIADILMNMKQWTNKCVPETPTTQTTTATETTSTNRSGPASTAPKTGYSTVLSFCHWPHDRQNCSWRLLRAVNIRLAIVELIEAQVDCAALIKNKSRPHTHCIVIFVKSVSCLSNVPQRDTVLMNCVLIVKDKLLLLCYRRCFISWCSCRTCRWFSRSNRHCCRCCCRCTKTSSFPFIQVSLLDFKK